LVTDIGFHFDGTTQILFRFTEIFGSSNYYSRPTGYLTLTFSTNGLSTYYQLVFQWMNRKYDFVINLYLIPEGLLLTVNDDFVSLNHKFLGSFADGNRHHFYMRFFPTYIAANVDDMYGELSVMDLEFFQGGDFIIGGGYTLPLQPEGINYTGCISIVAISLTLIVLAVLLFGLIYYCRRRVAHGDTYDTQENYKKGQDHFDEIGPETPLVDPTDPEQSLKRKGSKDISEGRNGKDVGKMSPKHSQSDKPRLVSSGAYDYSSDDMKYVDDNEKRLSHEYPPPTPLRKFKRIV
uniref:LAM_G_DOMAIN domain-containing protein n=1 Tax=Soboliphyme baturini TaxID=241478 RepID=A0A183IZV3_9BILA